MSAKKTITTIAVASLALAFSASGFAGGPEPAPQEAFGSFYIGTGLDFSDLYLSERGETSRYNPNSALFPAPEAGSTTRVKGEGYQLDYAHLFVGYETSYWHRLNVALEAFVGYTPYDDDGSVRISNTDLPDIFNIQTLRLTQGYTKSPWSFGIALMPGFAIQPNAAIYARVGYVGNQFLRSAVGRYTQPRGTVNISGSNIILSTYSNHQDRTLGALQLGLGIKTRVSEHLSLREGYYWTGYDSASRTIVTGPDAGSRTFYQNSTIYPTIENFDLSLSYSFSPPTPFYPATPVNSSHAVYAGVFGSRDQAATTDNTGFANWFTAAPANGVFVYQPENLKMRGWGVQPFVGYRYTFQSGPYVGAEVFYHGSSEDATSYLRSFIPAAEIASTSTTVETERLKLTNFYGLDFIGGYNFSDEFMLYAKLGVAEARWSHQSSQTSNIPLYDSFGTYSMRKNIYGYQVGLGVSVKLAGNLFLRNEFVVTEFNKFNQPRVFSVGRPTPPEDEEGLAIERHYSIYSEQYNMGLEYRLPF